MQTDTGLPKMIKQELDKIIYRMEVQINRLSAILIHLYASTLWVDFMNADPKNTESMWLVYDEFRSFVNDLRVHFHCSRDIREHNLLSDEDFLTIYPVLLQVDAEKLHRGMLKYIDEAIQNQEAGDLSSLHMEWDEEDIMKKSKERLEQQDRATAAIIDDADVPFPSFTTGVERVKRNGRYYPQHELHTPAAMSRNWWLAIIYEGLLIYSIKHGKMVVKRCADPKCGKYFAPRPRSHNQLYHSKRCRNRHHSENWRKSSRSSPNK